jgi:hypothetical protein
LLIPLVAVAAPALAAVTTAVRQAESAVRVRPERRNVINDADARTLAGACDASWEAVSVAAPDGLILRAWLFQPTGWNGHAVLALHGFTDSRRGMLDHARLLLEDGFAVLAPDSRGHGSSDGDVVSFGVREKFDVPAWGDWLCVRFGLERYYAIGASMGAAVLLQALPIDTRIAAAVADSSFTRFEVIAYERFAGRMGVAPAIARTLLRPVVSTGWRYIRARYGLDLRETRPIDDARRARCPLLFVHGEDDPSIPVRHSRELHQAAAPGSELWTVPGAGHAESVRVDPVAYRQRMAALFRSSEFWQKQANLV